MKYEEYEKLEKEVYEYIQDKMGDEVWNILCDKMFPTILEDAAYEAGVIDVEDY